MPSDPIRYPKNVPEVIAIVKEAISRKTTVKAFGHRFSVTDIICTDGIPVDMRGIQGMKLNEDFTATVGAGVYLREFTAFLRKNGRALKTIPSFGNITIGGAIGTGSHGSSIKHNCSISAQVIRLTIVNGVGNLQMISSAEDLFAFRVHLGLLGIVVRATFRTVPLYKVRAHNYVASEEILTNGSIFDIARNTDQISVYWFPSFRKVVIANWTIVDVNTTGNAYTNDHTPSTTASFNSYVVPTVEIIQGLKNYIGAEIIQAYTLQTLLTTIPDFVPIYTENGITVQNPAVGYYDLMFAPICQESGVLQCEWFHGPTNNLTFLDNEITFPLELLPDFVKELKDIASRTPAVFPMFGILLRFSAPSPSYMSTHHGFEACHFEFYTLKRKNPYFEGSLCLAAYQAILQTLVSKYSGRSHWGKTGFYYHSADIMEQKLDPAARAAFVAKMHQFDPNGIFLNAFGKRIKGVGRKMNMDPSTLHCALLDNCICSTDDDCALDQTCSRITDYPDYPVCAEKFQLPPIILDPIAYLFNTNLTIDSLICSSVTNTDVLSQMTCASIVKKLVSLLEPRPENKFDMK